MAFIKQLGAIAIVAICLLNFITALPTSAVDDSNVLALEDWGTFNGKRFYGDAVANRAWDAASAACVAAGYRLVTIESKEESAFLAITLATKSPLDWFWTSARDSRLLESMQWNTTEQIPKSDLFEEFIHTGSKTAFTHCGAVIGVPNSSKLFMRAYAGCSSTTVTMKVLCECARCD